MRSIIFTTLPFTLTLAAQEPTPTPSEPQMSQLSIIAVGEAPITRFISGGKDDIGRQLIVEKEVPAYMLPPKAAYYSDNGDDEKRNQINIHLNAPSRPITFPSDQPISIFTSPAGNGTLIKITPPKMPQSQLLILHRAPDKINWNLARQKLIPNDWNTFPAGATRIVNTSPYPAVLLINQQKTAVAPGNSLIIPPNPDSNQSHTTYKVAVKTPKENQLIKFGSLTSLPDRRNTLYIYQNLIDQRSKLAAVTTQTESKSND